MNERSCYLMNSCCVISGVWLHNSRLLLHERILYKGKYCSHDENRFSNLDASRRFGVTVNPCMHSGVEKIL